MVRKGVPDYDDNNGSKANNDDASTTPGDKATYVDAFDRAHPPTSIHAFHVEEDSGRNQRKRDIVARVFKQFSPGSSAEVLHAAGLGQNLNLWRARVAELTNDGVLKKIDKRRCRVTNHEAAILQYVEPKDRVRRVRIDPRDAVLLDLCDVLDEIASDPAVALGADRLAKVRELVVVGRNLVRRERPRHEASSAQATADA